MSHKKDYLTVQSKKIKNKKKITNSSVYAQKEEKDIKSDVTNNDFGDMEKNQTKLSFTNYELLFSQICYTFYAKKHKFRLLLNGLNIISEKLDITGIVKENINFQRLKSIIFSDYQLHLFNLL